MADRRGLPLMAVCRDKALLILLLLLLPGLLSAQESFRAQFDPLAGVFPTPINLLFSGSLDGTLNIPVVDPADPSSVVLNALNMLDGFSTLAPMTATFNDALDPMTVVAGQTVRVFEVAAVNPFLQPDTPIPFVVTGLIEELIGGEDYSAGLLFEDATQSTLLITPLRPLRPKTAYMVVLTDGIRSADGRFPFPELTYIFARYRKEPLVDAEGNSKFQNLSNLQARLLEPLRRVVVSQEDAAAAAGIPRGSIVLSWSFFTQSIDDSLQAIRAGVDPQPLDLMPAGIDTGALGLGLAGIADIYSGALRVPYYLEAPNLVPSIILTTHWRGVNASALTRYNPLPVAPQHLTIPVLATVPNGASGHSRPATGWPVVIVTHGIGRNRGDVLLTADALAAAGLASIAIDLPLHGITGPDDFFGAFYQGVSERTFNVDLIDNETSAPGPDGLIDPSGVHMINFTSLLTSRDNLRQGVSDLMYLSASLGGADLDVDAVPDFDISRLHLLGNSLGAVVASVFLGVDDSAVGAASLTAAGGGIAKLLDGSESFAPVLQAGLAAVGLFKGTPEYEAFLRATQQVMDAGDPINYAAAAAAYHPLHLMEIVGPPPDATVPNSVADAPLSGTEPLADAMNLTAIDSTAMDEAGIRAIVRFSQGLHSSLVNAPATPEVTAEMQQQAVGFLASDGVFLPVDNSDIIVPVP